MFEFKDLDRLKVYCMAGARRSSLGLNPSRQVIGHWWTTPRFLSSDPIGSKRFLAVRGELGVVSVDDTMRRTFAFTFAFCFTFTFCGCRTDAISISS